MFFLLWETKLLGPKTSARHLGFTLDLFKKVLHEDFAAVSTVGPTLCFSKE